jgi:hypothetical protein
MREQRIKTEAWPYWSYKTKREWKKDVRKRWTAYRKAIRALHKGCAFYPDGVTLPLARFDEQDRIMKNWFKNV